jgi:parallel beta-helix repeat protein
MNGLMMYYCREMEIRGNIAGRNSCFGFILYETSDCTLKDNTADYCGRFPIRPDHTGQKEIDSAGFLLLHNACRNTFTGNASRMSASGFRICGLTPKQESVGCNNNRFEMCDASHNLNIGFNVSHSHGNTFIKNQASLSNNGFFLITCRETKLSGNTIQGNHRAGIAAQNGAHCQVENNTIQDNHFGILLWSQPDPDLLTIFPENDTSKFWLIQRNSLHRNHTGLRIAANQDQGVLPLKGMKENPETYLRPHDHEIRFNDIANNRVGIQTAHCDRTVIQDNSFSLNLTGDIKS